MQNSSSSSLIVLLKCVFLCTHTHALSTMHVSNLIHDCTHWEREREGWHCGRVPSTYLGKGGGGLEEGDAGAEEKRNRQIPEGRKADGGKGWMEGVAQRKRCFFVLSCHHFVLRLFFTFSHLLSPIPLDLPFLCHCNNYTDIRNYSHPNIFLSHTANPSPSLSLSLS